MNFLKKTMKSIVSLSLCLCTILSVAVINASAAEKKPLLFYSTPIEDCCVLAYYSEGGSIECTKATPGFLMETGIRVYKATPKEGYKFDGWSYELMFRSINVDRKNRKSLGRYTFSQVGNKKIAYDDKENNNGKSEEIQLNRLSSLGECVHKQLYYVITANFSKI